MKCPKCKEILTLELDLNGGCQGHGPEEYCYCDSLDVYFMWRCNTCKCYPNLPRPKGLVDRYEIEAWVNVNYKEPV